MRTHDRAPPVGAANFERLGGCSLLSEECRSANGISVAVDGGLDATAGDGAEVDCTHEWACRCSGGDDCPGRGMLAFSASTAAASCGTSSSPMFTPAMPVTTCSPLVSVPVLSKRTASIVRIRSGSTPRIQVGRVQLTPWGRLASVRGPSTAPARLPSPNPSVHQKCCEVAMQIALVLYPKFTVLDIIGPFQALVDVPGHDVVFVAEEAGPVIDHTGRCPLVASTSFKQVLLA